MPFGPTRIVDSRSGLGVTAGAITAGGTLLVPASAVQIFGSCSAANCSPLDQADVLNVTVTAPQAAGDLTVYPAYAIVYGASTTTAIVSLVVVDLATGTVTATIPISANVSVPAAVAVDPDTDTIYALDPNADSLLVISGVTNTVTATITGLGRVTIVLDEASPLAVDPVTDTVYVGLTGATAMDVIDGATNTITAAIPADIGSESVAVDPATDMIYDVGYSSGVAGQVLVISGSTNSVTGTAALPDNPEGLAVDPSTDTFYVFTGPSKAIYAYSGSSDSLTGTVSVGNFVNQIAINPQAGTLYASEGQISPAGSSFLEGGVALISDAADAVTGTVVVPPQANGVAVDPATNTLVVVENESDLLIVPLRAPSITGGALRICYAGQPCGMTFQVTGSPAPGISFSGTLPAGMVNVGGGTLLGIPAAGATGTYPIAVTAANAMGAVTQEFTIVVRPGTEWFRPPPTRPAPVLLPRMTTLPRGGEDA